MKAKYLFIIIATIILTSIIVLLLNNYFTVKKDPYSFLKPTEPISISFPEFKTGEKISSYFWVLPVEKEKERHRYTVTLNLKPSNYKNPTPEYLQNQQSKRELFKVRVFHTADLNKPEQLVSENMINELRLFPDDKDKQHEQVYPNCSLVGECYLATVQEKAGSYGLYRVEVEILQNIPELNFKDGQYQYTMDINKEYPRYK